MRLRLFLATLLAVVLSACSGGNDSPARPTEIPLASSPRPAGTATSQTSSATLPGDATGPLPQVRLQRTGDPLTFKNMTGMYEVPGTPGRFVVLEKPGRVIAFEPAKPAETYMVVLDIQDRVDDSSNEMGLLGLAFAPDFATSRAFYVNYTAGGTLRTVVSRFTADGGLIRVPASSEAKIIEIGQPYANHNGGEIRFGPDGLLYIGMGDGGSGNDPQGNGQKRDALLGKMLRIDVSGGSEGRAYRIPNDNPFAGQSGYRGEIWALGMRNPWRFTFDRQTGALWVGDVGQNAIEEVDIVKKGGNYGWNIMEGSRCRGGGNSCNRDGLELPVIDYQIASGNCAVVGGFVYRGEAIAALKGAYVYGDYCSGRVWALRWDGSKVTEQSQIAQVSGAMSSFAEDARGELYALAYGERGGIFKLVP